MMTNKGRTDILANNRKVAMCGLRRSIEDVSRMELTTSQAMIAIASEVKCTGSRNKNVLRELLMRSRTNRNKLSVIIKKRQSLQQHLDTLETSELNQQVLSSVRQTSDVLKSMGLEQKMESVDELMMDMAESHEDVRSIQNGLSTSFSGEIEQNDLDEELALLLGDDTEKQTDKSLQYNPYKNTTTKIQPTTYNSMMDTVEEEIPGEQIVAGNESVEYVLGPQEASVTRTESCLVQETIS